MKQLLKLLSNPKGNKGSSSPSRRRRVPQGHVPLLVGDDLERFAVPARLLSRPALLDLLRLSALEYGYEQRGVLRIPCPVPVFLQALAATARDDHHEAPLLAAELLPRRG